MTDEVGRDKVHVENNLGMVASEMYGRLQIYVVSNNIQNERV